MKYDWIHDKTEGVTSLNTNFIAGQARLPSGMAAQSMYEILTITAEIDKKCRENVSTRCTLATLYAKEVLKQFLRGYSILERTEAATKSIQEHYYGKAGSALESALKDLYKQYEKWKEYAG